VKALLIDPSTSGVSGDMLLSALVDMGVSPEPLFKLAEALPRRLKGVRRAKLEFKRVSRAGISATSTLIRVEEEGERSLADFYSALEELREEVSLSEYVYVRARRALELLEEAEKRVHGGGHVHLHELGSADTLLDVIGVPLLLEEGGLTGYKVISTPIGVGMGSVRIQHGVVSVPAPATLEILRALGIPFRRGPVEGELATPTGVAILGAVVDGFVTRTPVLRVLKRGYGAGARDYGTQPLGVFEVEMEDRYQHDQVAVLETNVDDVDGELLSRVREVLMERGALDVYYYPAVAKKGRPGFMVQVLARPQDAWSLLDVLFTELGTLGVRVNLVDRARLEREIREVVIEVGGVEESVRVKVAYDREGRVVRVKPEHADLERIASRHGLTLRRVRDLVLSRVMTGLLGQGSSS